MTSFPPGSCGPCCAFPAGLIAALMLPAGHAEHPQLLPSPQCPLLDPRSCQLHTDAAYNAACHLACADSGAISVGEPPFCWPDTLCILCVNCMDSHCAITRWNTQLAIFDPKFVHMFFADIMRPLCFFAHLESRVALLSVLRRSVMGPDSQQ